jgi:hypothetical protein
MAEEINHANFIFGPLESAITTYHAASRLAPALVFDSHAQRTLGDGHELGLHDPFWNSCVEYDEGEDWFKKKGLEPSQSRLADQWHSKTILHNEMGSVELLENLDHIIEEVS